MINDKMLSEIKLHARESAPNESCGLIVNVNGHTHYRRCENISPSIGGFDINSKDLIAAESVGEIMSIVHSHVSSDESPSEMDRVECVRSKLPWVIYSLMTDRFSFNHCDGSIPDLIGREFAWGIFDCFTLLRDYYLVNFNITIETPPEGYEQNFWKRGKKFYSRFEEFGFFQIPVDEQPKLHDVFLMRIRSDEEPNHAGIYVGDGLMLHHLEKQLSSRVPYGGSWSDATVFIVRHKSLCH